MLSDCKLPCLWYLDGTTNFAHGYPSFAVSVGVLFRGRPAAAAVVLNSQTINVFVKVIYVNIVDERIWLYTGHIQSSIKWLHCILVLEFIHMIIRNPLFGCQVYWYNASIEGIPWPENNPHWKVHPSGICTFFFSLNFSGATLYFEAVDWIDHVLNYDAQMQQRQAMDMEGTHILHTNLHIIREVSDTMCHLFWCIWLHRS